MANTTITNVDVGSVLLANAQFRDETLNFSGADTYAEGTILARRSVASAVVAAADAGNTGDGTVTLATVAAGQVVPMVGAYNFECIEAVTHGGIFKLVDPNGGIVDGYVPLTAATGGTTVIETGGLTFTVTDGATDFIVGDKFSLTVAADGDLVAFATDGAGGVQIPVAILPYEIVVTASGDVPIRAAVSGSYKLERLVIDADGDASNITDAVIDQLRDYGLVPINVNELNILDNQ